MTAAEQNSCNCQVHYYSPSNSQLDCIPINNCANNNGGCQIHCTNDGPELSHCSCQTGYSLDPDQLNCHDSTAPSITCPAYVKYQRANGSTSSIITYSTTSTDNVGVQGVSCTHGSGTSFTADSTLVTCSATDSVGNIGTCSFTVHLLSLKGPYYFDVLCTGPFNYTYEDPFDEALISTVAL